MFLSTFCVLNQLNENVSQRVAGGEPMLTYNKPEEKGIITKDIVYANSLKRYAFIIKRCRIFILICKYIINIYVKELLKTYK